MNRSVAVSIAAVISSTLYFAGDGSAQSPAVGKVGSPTPQSIDAIDVPSARADFFAAAPGSDFFERGDRITRVYGRAFSHGKSPSQSAESFIRDHSDIFGVEASTLLPLGAFPDAVHSVDVYWDDATQSFRFTLLGYSQIVSGVPVFRSALKLLMRNETGFPMVLASADLRDLGAFPSTLQARPSLAQFPAQVWSSEAIRIARVEEPTETQLVIFAGYDNDPHAPTLAVSFIVERGVLSSGYSKMLYVAEATTGKILFQEEQVCNADIPGTVQGMATTGWAADACAPEIATGLPYAAVSSGAQTVYANAQGAFIFPNAGTGAISLTSNLTVGGLYFKVDNVAGAESTITNSAPSGVPTSFLHNSLNTVEVDRAQVNAYLHANIVRDFVIAANPSYPTIAGQQGATAFQINVAVSGTCNAFYNGSSINFYNAGGGCNNTAFSTVVHHEYGHHLVAAGGSGQGAYGEGMGDVMGALISETPALGVGFQNCSSGIRNASNTCQFDSAGCSSCGSAIHACGQLLSGCVWDTRNNLAVVEPANFRTIVRNLTVNSVLLHTGSTIAGDITVDFLTLDDNDGDLSNGSPHFAAINSAFTAHGLPGPALSPLNFTVIGGIPAYAAPNAALALTLQLTALGSQPQPNTGRLHWRTGASAFQSVAMTQTSTNVYAAIVPMAACGVSVDYYFEAKTTTNVVVTNPLSAPSSFHSTTGGYGATVAVSDSLEIASAWVIGATGDNATTGIWTRVNPIGTAAQPEDDHTPEPGVNCFVTGQGTAGGGLGEQDVDGGVTTLMSPSFEAAGLQDARVSYWRWYSNNTGSAPNLDSMPIEISNNNGTSWVQLELVTENANAWVSKSFRISDFVTPTATMRIRFIARDLDAGSLVEAGVDDFQVTGVSCTPPFVPADLNQDGSVNGTDLATLLSAWNATGGDINQDGTTDGADLAILLSAWTG